MITPSTSAKSCISSGRAMLIQRSIVSHTANGRFGNCRSRFSCTRGCVFARNTVELSRYFAGTVGGASSSTPRRVKSVSRRFMFSK